MIVKKNREDLSSSQNAKNFSKRQGVYILFEQIIFEKKSDSANTNRKNFHNYRENSHQSQRTKK